MPSDKNRNELREGDQVIYDGELLQIEAITEETDGNWMLRLVDADGDWVDAADWEVEKA